MHKTVSFILSQPSSDITQSSPFKGMSGYAEFQVASQWISKSIVIFLIINHELSLQIMSSEKSGEKFLCQLISSVIVSFEKKFVCQPLQKLLNSFSIHQPSKPINSYPGPEPPGTNLVQEME
jgi:hypothetical protein